MEKMEKWPYLLHVSYARDVFFFINLFYQVSTFLPVFPLLLTILYVTYFSISF